MIWANISANEKTELGSLTEAQYIDERLHYRVYPFLIFTVSKFTLMHDNNHMLLDVCQIFWIKLVLCLIDNLNTARN